jgi:gluconate kinase
VPDVYFVHLAGSREGLASRLSDRVDHFMPLALLDSQLSTLEPLRADELGVTLDLTHPADELARSAVESLSRP